MKTSIIVKTDVEVKKKAKRLAEEAGLTLSDVVNVSLHRFVETGTLTVSVAPRMTKKLERTIAGAERELAEGGVRFYGSAETFIASLNAPER
jgi:antitoxin component of RelBE/YafQ-DinJ toxin-antitoxin module